jgi:hypothetical protein
MLKKIGIAVAIAATVVAAATPAAVAHGDIKDWEYLINLDHRHDTHDEIYIYSGRGCNRGGATSASGSIATLSTSDSCDRLHGYYDVPRGFLVHGRDH